MSTLTIFSETYALKHIFSKSTCYLTETPMSDISFSLVISFICHSKCVSELN